MPTRIHARLQQCITLAEQQLGQRFPIPDFSFNLRGQAAGMACPQSNSIRFNALLYRENTEHFLQQTVPHELAHLIASRLHGPRIRPHGPEWQGIMRNVFGLPAERCHSYALPPRWRTMYLYQCGCPQREHGLSAQRHARIAKGNNYLCRACKTLLTFTGKDERRLVER